MMRDRTIHPMGVKMLLASDLTGAIHGYDAAAEARVGFQAQFSRRSFSEVAAVPVLDREEHAENTVAELFVAVSGLVRSNKQVRRTAQDGGLRLISEIPGQAQESIRLTETDVFLTIAQLVEAYPAQCTHPESRIFLKSGRSLLELH